MGWTYFQELVETPSHSEIGLKQSPIVSLNATHKAFYSPECEQVILSPHLYGTTLPPSQRTSLLSLLTSLWEDSLAKTSQSREKGLVSHPKPVAACSIKSSDSLKNSDPPLFFSKTYLPLENEDLTSFYTNLPKQGMTVGGLCYRLQVSVPATSVRDGSSLLPTLSKSIYHSNVGGGQGRIGKVRYSVYKLAQMGDLEGHPKGLFNPEWGEMAMGFLIGWTELGALETLWFLNKL